MLEKKQSRARKLTDPKGVAREHYLGDYLPYLSVIRDGVILLRDGDVMASFVVEGVNADTAEDTLIDDVAQTMSANVAQAEADTAFYVHRFSHEVDPSMPPVTGDGFAAQIDRHWQSTLLGLNLRQRTTMVTVVIRPQTLSTLWAKLTGGSSKSGRDLMERRISRLEDAVATMMQALSATRPERLMASDGRWLGLLKMMTTGKFSRVRPPRDFRPVRDLITDSRVDFRGDTFFVAGMDSADLRWGAMFCLKGYPNETLTGFLGNLDLPANTVVGHSFTPIDMVPALSRVQRTARQMSAADDAAISAREDLVNAADDLASGRINFGHHQLTIMVTTRRQDELDALSSRIRTALQRIQGVPVREDIGARSAYFAQHPGNFAHRARPAMISSACFADFAALHGANKGLLPGEEPWGAPITTLPTLTGEPYRFNFHLAGSTGDLTVGHTLVIGRTGSGKSLGTAFLLAQAQRVRPRIIVFDKDRGLEAPMRALGGSYSPVRLGEPTGFNPFRAESDTRGTAWLTDWLGALLTGGGADPLSPMQAEALASAAQTNAEADPGLQTLPHFRSQFLSVDDDGDLHTRMAPWDEGGQYDWLFTGTDADPLAFDNDVTGFDLSEVLDIPAVRTAWLSYVFRRIERTVEDGRPTLVVLDEAWKMLDDAYFQSRLKDWMLTMRKKNVAVVMLTQRVSHITESRAGGSILESAATQILFPSSSTTQGELDALRLTDAEADFLGSSSAGNRNVLIRNGDDSAVVDFDLSPLGPLLDVLRAGPRTKDTWKEAVR